MKEQWYGVTMSREVAEQFKNFLRKLNIYFEPSECYADIHIEFKTAIPFDYLMTDFEESRKEKEYGL